MKLSKDEIRVLKDIQKKDPKFWHPQEDDGIIDDLIEDGFASEKVEQAANKYWKGILSLTQKGIRALKR